MPIAGRIPHVSPLGTSGKNANGSKFGTQVRSYFKRFFLPSLCICANYLGDKMSNFSFFGRQMKDRVNPGPNSWRLARHEFNDGDGVFRMLA